MCNKLVLTGIGAVLLAAGFYVGKEYELRKILAVQHELHKPR